MSSDTQFSPKTDYLKEDPAIYGQVYSIVSFVNPKDAVLTKNLYYMNKFMVSDINKTITAQAQQMARKLAVDMRNKIVDVLDKLKASIDPEDKHMSRILETRFREMLIDEDEYVETCRRKYELDAEEITDKYKIYLSQNRQAMDIQYDNKEDAVCNVRGFKIRGTYARMEDAKVRAKFLRDNVEQGIHVFIVPTGTWFPIDMDADEVQDQEYMLPQLNELMGKYHEGVHARDQHYRERKEEMSSGTTSTKSRLQAKLLEKRRLKMKEDIKGLQDATEGKEGDKPKKKKKKSKSKKEESDPENMSVYEKHRAEA